MDKRFSINASRHGGAKFAMFLFVLCLITSGLMFFYFQRCRALERELATWRNGGKPVRQQKTAAKDERGSLADIASVMREKIIGAPAGKKETKKKNEAEEPAVDEPLSDTPSVKSTPKPANVPEPAADAESEKEPEPPARQERTVLREKPVLTKADPEPTPDPAAQEPTTTIKRDEAGEQAARATRRVADSEVRNEISDQTPASANPRKTLVRSAYEKPKSVRATPAQQTFTEAKTDRPRRGRITSQYDVEGTE